MHWIIIDRGALILQQDTACVHLQNQVKALKTNDKKIKAMESEFAVRRREIKKVYKNLDVYEIQEEERERTALALTAHRN